MHGDASAADGIYGAYIPAQNNSQWVRYYIEAKAGNSYKTATYSPVSYTHLRAHETVLDLVCRLLLEKKKITKLIK